MGIPSFASRMRGYGAVDVLGRRGEPQNDGAVVDGPSLAHSLIQQTAGALQSNDGAIMPRYSYSALGAAAIAWLRSLEEYGFHIEAIYFDGILPEHKKETRLQRLQAYIDKLVVFKAIHDGLAKAAKNARSGIPPKQMETQLERAQRSLPPPPFLVFAVVEALLDSVYANRTCVVDGEADDFCAARAMDLALAGDQTQVSIFTNDSDLMLFNFDRHVRIVQISEMSFDEDQPILTGLQYWPHSFRRSKTGKDERSLLKAAFLMKLDPHLSFRNAVNKAQQDPVPFSRSDFEQFAGMYDTVDASAKLRMSAGASSIASRLDSRVSEVVRKSLQQKERIKQVQAWYATKADRSLSQMRADLASGWPANGRPDLEVADGHSGTKHSGQTDSVDKRDFAYDQLEEDLKPTDMDIFLPVLFEDPSRATAWKAGSAIREVAMHLATSVCGTTATVQEYKRSGQRIRGAACEQISHEACHEYLRRWAKEWSNQLERYSALGPDRQWRIRLVELLLDDMAAQEMSLPSREAVHITLVQGPATNWDVMHLHAQYQAMYYSLRILKQVLGFVVATEQSKAVADLEHALRELKTLPTIATFSDSETRDNDTAWEAAVEHLLQCHLPTGNVPDITNSPTKRSRSAPRKRKRFEKARNVFDSLDDAEEA